MCMSFCVHKVNDFEKFQNVKVPFSQQNIVEGMHDNKK